MNKATEVAEKVLHMLKGIDRQLGTYADVPFGKRLATPEEQKDALIREIERLEQAGGQEKWQNGQM
jgi:hypothetical protein